MTKKFVIYVYIFDSMMTPQRFRNSNFLYYSNISAESKPYLNMLYLLFSMSIRGRDGLVGKIRWYKSCDTVLFEVNEEGREIVAW